MENSPFNKIPGELRNRIYRAAIVFDDSIKFNTEDVGREFPHPESADRACDGLALLSTCKQIRAEALSIFFAENRFEFSAEQPAPLWRGLYKEELLQFKLVVGGWLRMIGGAARHLKHVSFILSDGEGFRNFNGYGGNFNGYGDDTDDTNALVSLMRDLNKLLQGTAATATIHRTVGWSIGNPKRKVQLAFADPHSAHKAVIQALGEMEDFVKALKEEAEAAPPDSDARLANDTRLADHVRWAAQTGQALEAFLIAFASSWTS